MNKRSRTIPVTLFTECEQLLAQYRAALERLDGKADIDRFTDADLIAMAARSCMLELVGGSC
ncbi:MAG: hypothetical protein IT530_16175 [Burkholderiales bacterium]|nr:hypothetical protein [Burkholderiales bacterium]